MCLLDLTDLSTIKDVKRYGGMNWEGKTIEIVVVEIK